MKIRNLVRVQVLVSHNLPPVGFRGITPGEKLPDIFMDGDSSSAFSPPLLHYPSPAFTYSMYKSK
ncbi:hypothetical protein E2C01_037515 [Portunus trituberculatus]|uniref:Uncharacterized protein n=1 Tax=Portunus trituberculatus TaxID=210409 RepID=A0A5B7F8B8_PORTR|nr:hypothetical protein [Portunus trituberculatus]